MLTRGMNSKLRTFQIAILSDTALEHILLREYNLPAPLYFYDDAVSGPLFKINNNSFPIFFEINGNSLDIKSAFVFSVVQPDLLTEYFEAIVK